ncbi:uncharacterized protein FFUJ_12673 [Fusarium fujikuroi IMI 58289]|uniref:Uncharacterized protein n=1 Tax=Gibberella fujikuroi (strain CBS 195.34 / IMI 58289 / NRRL A-6831) TaxID=1279085 RepID=S0EDQ1_GIBF5|nr:uncharacterized protein FFUJ_12673 [Fusarium fujikuroi IMI 58289]CCT72780.1 uncharacterized protein FFUJ_12673 [Fusarium fujikuroi IMI 58289]SCO25253.1 uncharacterized protein FFM5_14030 [Fusarium fujikuroi]
MAWATTEENTCLRARQIRRYYDKHIGSEGPLKYGDKILLSDIDLATTFAPDYSLKLCAKGEEEYPEQWDSKPKSLSYTLSNFRLKAKELAAAMGKEIEDFMTKDATNIPPVFLGGNGDRAHVRSLELIAGCPKRELAEVKKGKNAAEEEAKQYLARAKKAEAQLKRRLGEREEEEEGEDDEDRKRKRRKIGEASDGVRETIH